jgi:alginate O-acetyltransferase complex protein AlgJ
MDRMMKTATPSLVKSSADLQAPNPAPHTALTLGEVWAGSCFIFLLLGGLLSNGYAWFNDQLTPITADGPSFMAGEPMQQLAHALAKAELPEMAARIERGLSWQFARDLGPRVREGRRNWLFLNDELTPYAHADKSAAARAQQVIDLQQQLASKGITLLVVVVPDKSRIAAAHLGKLHRPAAFSGRVAEWTQKLAQAGVEVLDLSPALTELQRQGEPAFFRTDSHWTEAGAQVAAAQVAQRIRVLGIVKPSDSSLRLYSKVISIRPGDLVRLAGLEGMPLRLQPRTELALQSRFDTAPVKSKGSSDNADLFGDDELPQIALIGTSFSRNSNFASFLAQALHTQIGNFALDGGDFSGAAQAYLHSAAFKSTPPKVLLWEIPERVLSTDAKNEKFD